MRFKGYGVIWNPKKSKTLVNFRNVDEYETSDEYEIELLMGAQGVESIGGEVAPAGPSRKELLAKAKELGVTGADRMSKADLAKVVSE